MSSSRVSGRLAFVLLALGAASSGCVVASGTGDETESAQAKGEESTGTTQSSLSSSHGSAHAAAVGTAASSGNDVEPPPIPLFRHGDALHPQVEEKQPAK